MGLVKMTTWCGLCRRSGKRRTSTPAFESVSALQGPALAAPPHTAAHMTLHASMDTNAFLTIRRAVILLAAKKVLSRFVPIHQFWIWVKAA